MVTAKLDLFFSFVFFVVAFVEYVLLEFEEAFDVNEGVLIAKASARMCLCVCACREKYGVKIIFRSSRRLSINKLDLQYRQSEKKNNIEKLENDMKKPPTSHYCSGV